MVILGWGSIKESYREFCNVAPKGYTITLIEPAELVDNSFKEPATKLKNKLDQLQIEEYILIGHSLGGAIAIQTALKYPEKIIHLYLINAEGVYEQINFIKTAIAYVLTGFHNFRQEAKLFLKAMIKIIPRPWYSYKLGQYAHNQDLLAEASKITVPTTIMWGKRDLVVPIHQGEQLHQAIKHSKFIVFDNCDHNWILNYPYNFWRNFMQ